MRKIGEEIIERLEYVPASLKVVEEVRAKYACSCGDALKTAPKPAQPIEKGLAGASLLAQVTVSKYANHCPLHREEVIFRCHGLELSRKTICGWMRQPVDLLVPLYERLKALAVNSEVVQTDDTPEMVLDPELQKTRTGRIWAYVGEHATVYDYTPTRKREGPELFLKQYRGYLQADAYPAYDTARNRAVVEAEPKDDLKGASESALGPDCGHRLPHRGPVDPARAAAVHCAVLHRTGHAEGGDCGHRAGGGQL